MPICIHSSLCFVVNTMSSGGSSPCCLDFSTMTDCNFELWGIITCFSCQTGYFHSNRKRTKDIIFRLYRFRVIRALRTMESIKVHWTIYIPCSFYLVVPHIIFAMYSADNIVAYKTKYFQGLKQRFLMVWSHCPLERNKITDDLNMEDKIPFTFEI